MPEQRMKAMTAEFLPDVDAASHFEGVMAFERVEWREGYVRIRVLLGPQHCNRQGYVHGGVIGALVDSAGLYAGVYDPDTGRARVAVTVSTSCQYMGTTKGDAVEAIGEVVRAGKSMFFTAARVMDPDSGAVLASGQGSYKFRRT